MSRFGWGTRIFTASVAFLFTWTYGGGVALADQVHKHVQARMDLSKLDAELKADRDAKEVKRKAAVAKMRAETDPDPKKVAAVKKRAADIAKVHPNDKLEAMAGMLEQLSKKPNPSKQELLQAQKVMDLALASPGLKKGSRAEKAILGAKTQVTIAQKTGHKSALQGALDPKKPQAIKPHGPKVGALKLPRREPRMLPTGMHGELTPELRQMYATADGAWVEGEHRRISAWELAAGADLELPGTKLASVGDAIPMLSSMDEGAMSPPTAADLAETKDLRFTTAVQALANSLNKDPRKLFNYVHDHIESQTYYGSKKGAAGALAEKRANDFDQSSLLIALLRYSNIPARYEYGSVELSKQQALELAGATDIHAATQLILSEGTPGSAVTDAAGNITGVRVERAWVRAYVPYGNYRGSGAATGEKVWVRLDPGMKRHTLTAPTAGRTLAAFDTSAYLAHPQSNTPLELYQAALVAAAKSSNVCETVDALLTRREIIADDFALLPVEHPAKGVASLMAFSEVPDSMRYHVSYALNGGTYATSLPELYGHHVTLRYVGDSASDQTAITNAGSIAALTEPYTVTLDGSLRVDGTEVNRFPGDQPGTPESLSVSVTIPGADPVVTGHAITSGGVYALKVSPDSTPEPFEQDAAQAVAAKRAAGANADDIDEAIATQAIELYSTEVGQDHDRAYALNAYVQPEGYSDIVAGRYLEASYAFGMPVSVHRGNYQIDVQLEYWNALGLDNDSSRAVALGTLDGYDASTREHLVWEQLLHREAISSVKTLQGANTSSNPVLTLTSAGQVGQLSGYSQDTVNEVSDALGKGQTVSIATHPVTYRQYSSVEAYIALDPTNGTGSYALGLLGSTRHRMLNGGGDDGSGTDNAAGSDTPSGDAPCACESSREQFSNGDRHDFGTDLTLPNPGIPLAWSRTYRTRTGRSTSLGSKWMPSYGVFLDLTGTTPVFVNEELYEIAFTANGTNAWSSAPQWHEALTYDGTQYHLRFKTGLIYDFDTSGKLVREIDLNGNTVACAYDGNGRLTTVTGSGGNAFTLAYDANGYLQTVTDSASRHVTYHVNAAGDLAEVDDVLGDAESMGYDDQHREVSVTDKNGNTKTEFYNSDGRWIGFSDALGNAMSVTYDDQHSQAAVTDKNGNTTLYAWNADGNPTSTTDAQGNTQTMTWSSDGAMNKTSITDGTGSTWTWSSFDANGNAQYAADPTGHYQQYSYDANTSKVTSRYEQNLGTTTLQYDSHGNLTQSTNPNNDVSTYTYQSNGLPQTVTQVGTGSTPSSTTTLSFNASGTLHTMTDGEGHTTTLGYDAAGHQTSIQDPNSHTRSMVVDARGQMHSTTDALNQTSSMTFDALGNRLTSTDQENHTTTFAYDALNRNTSVTDTSGHVSKTEYDAMGNVLARTDMNGNRTTYKYDALYRTVETTAADGSVTSMGYCGHRASSPCQTVDANGNVTTHVEDSLGRTTQMTDALSNATSLTLDTLGRLTALAQPNGVTRQTAFDSLGRVTDTYFAGVGVHTHNEYDSRGNRIQVTQSGDNLSSPEVFTFAFDRANRLTSESTPPAYNGISITTSYTYDAAGNRSTKVDGKNHQTSYTYDNNRRLRQVTFQDNSTYQYAYDSRGNRTLEKHVGPSGAVIHERHLAYDSLSRLQVSTDMTLNKVIAYTYDASGNKASMTVDGMSFTYRYDTQHRLIEALDQDGEATRLTYDANGNRTSMVLGNGIVRRDTFDAKNQTKKIKYTKGSTALQEFDYTLDASGNRLRKDFLDGSSENYQYDAADRLKYVRYPNGQDGYYQLSGANNIQDAPMKDPAVSGIAHYAYTVNSANQVTHRSAWSNQPALDFAYDANGNLVNKTPADGSGATTYVYDEDNRMVEVDLPGNVTDMFAYDANGIRVEKIDSTSTTKYLLDGASVVAEYDAANTLKATHHNNPQRIDEQFSFTRSGVKYYPLTDALGSVYALTDASGAVVATYSYDPYGQCTRVSGSIDMDWRFTGRESDHDTGLNYNRDRYLSPALEVWTQADRLGLATGLNHYAYVDDRPAGYIDPHGQFLWLVALVIIAVLYVNDDQTGIQKGSPGEYVADYAVGEAAFGAAGALCEWYNANRAVRGIYLGKKAAMAARFGEMTAENAEQVARELVDMRNQARVETWEYMADEEVDLIKMRNLNKYGNEFGPTAEQQLGVYGSWEEVAKAAMRSNSFVDFFFGYW